MMARTNWLSSLLFAFEKWRDDDLLSIWVVLIGIDRIEAKNNPSCSSSP